MKLKRQLSILFIALTFLGLLPQASAQETIALSNSVVNVSAQDKLQALESTRFHFIALKQVYVSLFPAPERKISLPDEVSLPDFEAKLLNAALNAFLNSKDRETTLLDALRQNKAIQLKFSISKPDEEAYQMVTYPDKPILYRIEPARKSIPVSIEIRPLLDKPVAFKIALRNGNQNSFYDVDWAGKVIRIS